MLVKSGVSISGVSGTAEGEVRQLAWAEMDFYLEIEDESPVSDVDEVLTQVLDHLSGFVRSLSGGAKWREARLNLKCNGPTLERFTEMVS